MISIIKREFKNYFSSPLGYAVLCVLMFFGGFYYSYAFSYGSADMTYVFNSVITIVFFVVPVITMRLFSEEKRLKTDRFFRSVFWLYIDEKQENAKKIKNLFKKSCIEEFFMLQLFKSLIFW